VTENSTSGNASILFKLHDSTVSTTAQTDVMKLSDTAINLYKPLTLELGTAGGHILNATASTTNFLEFRDGGTRSTRLGLTSAGSQITGSSNGDFFIRTNGKNIWMATDETGAADFRIDTTGAVVLGPPSGLTTSHTIRASSSGGVISQIISTATTSALFNYVVSGSSSAGYIGSSSSYPLEVLSGAAANAFRVPAGLGDGTLTLTSKVVGVSSDIRLKNLTENQDIPGLEEILAITPARYTWKNPDMGDAVHLGFIAQDVQPHIPEAVGKPGEDGMLGFYDRPVLAAAVKAIQELAAQVDDLKAELAALKGA